MIRVRDDPLVPDPGFAELYFRLPDATDLAPWLDWAREAGGPVLYLGAGAGRLAVPLAALDIELVLVEPHPDMAAILSRRLPRTELVEQRAEVLGLGRRFDLVMAPSGLLGRGLPLLEAAARHLASGGRLGFELMNPHWLRAGAGEGVRVLDMNRKRARIEVEYQFEDGAIYLQEADGPLLWPEKIEPWLRQAGLRLESMLGSDPEGSLRSSPIYYVSARHR